MNTLLQIQDDDIQSFYSTHGPFSDPGPYVSLYRDLPRDLDALCGMVNGLIVHDIWTHMGQLQLPEERKGEIHIRSMRDRLKNIQERDARPLSEPRPFPERSYGCCRDEALMLCSFLRQLGIPARVRKGFQANMGPEKLDHAICQVWSEEPGRWLTVDVQMDNMARERRRLPQGAQDFLSMLTPRDTPPENFLTGGQAWLKCRQGEDDPMTYCIQGDLRGMWFIRHNLLRDLLALNKYELLCWDNIPGSLISDDRSDPAPEWMAFLDHVAEVTVAVDECFSEVRRLYEETPAIHVPANWR